MVQAFILMVLFSCLLFLSHSDLFYSRQQKPEVTNVAATGALQLVKAQKCGCGNSMHMCCMCTGRLTLNMNKDVYMQLGLEGKSSKFVQKQKSRYVVNIDLISAHFVPSKKNYKRVEWCFTERLNLAFDFIISWVPYGNKNKLL